MLFTSRIQARESPCENFAAMLYPLFVVFLGKLAAGNLIAPLCSKPPQIDGVGNDSCWTGQPWQSGFTVLGDPKRPAVPDTAFKVIHDGRNLYLLIQCAEPRMASLVVTSAPEVDAPRRWKDDSLESALSFTLKKNNRWSMPRLTAMKRLSTTIPILYITMTGHIASAEVMFREPPIHIANPGYLFHDGLQEATDT